MNNEKTSSRYAYALPSELAGRQGQPGKFVGSFVSRAAAELKARQNADDLVKVWTGEMVPANRYSFSDLVNLKEMIQQTVSRHADLSEGTEEALDALHQWRMDVHDVPLDLECRQQITAALDAWATRYNLHPCAPTLMDIQEGQLAHPYEPMGYRRQEANMRNASDSPVENEIHYRVLQNRRRRFRARENASDLEGRPLAERAMQIRQALHQWDAHLPLAILTVYENRICLLKRALRSPWTKEHGIDYPRIQRELHWLRWRTTQIYQARCRSKEQRRRDYQAAQQPSTSEIPNST